MADSSFDIVSKIDQMELDNAFNQCDREIATRFDFKNTDTKIEKTALKVVLESSTEERAKAALDVFKDKLIKRNSKSRDDLQTAIAQVKKETWDFAVQFTNYR